MEKDINNANVWQVIGHFWAFTNYIYFFCIKPANIKQVVGRLLNLSDGGRSLVGFRVCETFSSQPANVWQVSGRFFSLHKPV